MKRLVGGVMIALLMIGGWTSPGQAQTVQEQAQVGKDFYQKIDQINKLAKTGKWQEALKVTSELRSLYQKKQWKLQLLGDEGEYEGLNRELDKLDAAVQAKDKAQTKVELAAVRSLVEAIYSL